MKEAAVRDGVHAIQAAVFLAAGGFDKTSADMFPAPGLVTQAELERYIGAWPDNPYTGKPMQPGKVAGDYAYTLGDGGKSYRLVGYGQDGKVLITVEGR